MPPFLAIIRDTSVHLDFPSTYHHVDTAIATVSTFLRHKHIACNVFALALVLREGMTNAIKHGNHENPGQRVVCELRVEPAALHISIADEGPGFCWQRHRIEAVRAHVPHGRGLWLMHVYGFDVSHNSRGNVLFLQTALPHI
ncbi:MAG: ATP-binding protein [Candidatus Tectimicrobiota bacterium]